MKNKDLLKFEDLDENNALKIGDWGLHTNPLFFDYNIVIRTRDEAKFFSKSKNFKPFNKYYAIIYDGKMEGFIGLKKINPLTKSSVLGLVLNPSSLGQGLGSLALREFLHIYFTDLKMKVMYLDVASYNPRAIRLYEKLSFKKINTYVDIYPNGDIDWTSPYMEGMEDKFTKKFGKWYYKVISMELRKEDFDEIYYRKTGD